MIITRTMAFVLIGTALLGAGCALLSSDIPSPTAAAVVTLTTIISQPPLPSGTVVPAFMTVTQLAPINTNTPTPAGTLLQFTPTPTEAVTEVMQLAWFYKPPSNVELATVVQHFDTFILTHKDEEERDEMRQLGLRAPVLQYLTIYQIHDPESCDTIPRGNQAAYKAGDFCDISANHRDWFLFDTNGNRIREEDTELAAYLMDLNSPGWQEFFVNRANEMKEEFGWDGLFMDNFLKGRYSQDDVLKFVSYVRANYKGVLFANSSGLPGAFTGIYDPYLDGMMIEGWSLGWRSEYLSVNDWVTHIARAEAIQAEGKFAILVAQGQPDTLEKQQFALASFLLVANGRAAFRYTRGDAYQEVWLYENYNIKLGRPLGGRYWAGPAWRRDFAHGYVMVNPATHLAKIELTASPAP